MLIYPRHDDDGASRDGVTMLITRWCWTQTPQCEAKSNCISHGQPGLGFYCTESPPLLQRMSLTGLLCQRMGHWAS